MPPRSIARGAAKKAAEGKRATATTGASGGTPTRVHDVREKRVKTAASGKPGAEPFEAAASAEGQERVDLQRVDLRAIATV